MKIAICSVQEFNPTIGGIERVSVSLAEGLIKEGVEVLFVACRKSPYSKPYTLPAKQVLLPKTLDYCIENVQALAHILKEEKVDILLNQNSHSELYNRTCYEVKSLSGVKLILLIFCGMYVHVSLSVTFSCMINVGCTRICILIVTGLYY